VTLEQIITYTVIAVLLGLWFGELLARRQADAQARYLRIQLEDSIELRMDVEQENRILRNSFDLAINERNAANLRAQRAINAVRQLPAVKIKCPLPAEQTGAASFNLN
jgi:hypothetical protein